MTAAASPLLTYPGAVAAAGGDLGVAAHYGSFNAEQRRLVEGDAFVDLSHRPVLRISGPDRLSWLHSLTTQYFEGLQPGAYTEALILSPQGHVEHAFAGADDGESFTAHTEPGMLSALIAWLEQMKFMTRVEVADVTDSVAVAWRAGSYTFVPRERLEAFAEAAGAPAGIWAHEALRISRGEVRIGLDTDHRTIPNETAWMATAVHLDKGCYRGQETVARVHTLGRPPRRLTWLHLDGSENRLPEPGAAIEYDGRSVGRMGSAARHYEVGPIGLALLKRSVPTDAVLTIDGLSATQEVLVDPEVGLHVRPQMGR